MAVFNKTMFLRKRIVYKNLYAAITKQHFSIKALAHEVEIAPARLKKKLFGKEFITLKEASRISEILKHDIHYLFQELVP